jgi:adenylate kinase
MDIPHISTGDLFRANMSQNTPLGVEARTYVDAGELVPDEVTNAMVRERLGEPDGRSGFLLDGFPRTVGQAKVLAEILAEQGVGLDAVLVFEVSEDEVVRRMLARGRGDDTEDVIRRRLAVFRHDTEPLLEHYADLVVPIQAEGEIDDITARALEALRARA